MSLIRKISIGSNYPNGVLHYQVGKPVKMGEHYKNIVSIEEAVENNKKVQNIYVEAEKKASVLWKKVEDVPVVIEYLIDFE